MNVEEPYWLELDREDNYEMLFSELCYYMTNYGAPIIVLIILRNSKHYKYIKLQCYQFNFVSQVVRTYVIKKNSLSIASNVLR